MNKLKLILLVNGLFTGLSFAPFDPKAAANKLRKRVSDHALSRFSPEQTLEEFKDSCYSINVESCDIATARILNILESINDDRASIQYNSWIEEFHKEASGEDLESTIVLERPLSQEALRARATFLLTLELSEIIWHLCSIKRGCNKGLINKHRDLCYEGKGNHLPCCVEAGDIFGEVLDISYSKCAEFIDDESSKEYFATKLENIFKEHLFEW